MIRSPEFVFALITSFLVALIIVTTQRLHGRYTHDYQNGVQKVHSCPTPRIGGVALFLGALVGCANLQAETQWFGFLVFLASLPAFVFGLAEDFTKRISVRSRLISTVLSGLAYSLMTGYQIQEVSLPAIDWMLAYWLPSLFFTAFAIGGVANALNIIDGVNGLASGTALIVILGFATLAWHVGDDQTLGTCLVTSAILVGFLALNFPMGRIFLGDAGAYLTGFILAVIAVALPQRNPEVSPLIGILALSYPVIETVVSIHRRTVRKGSHPGHPDRLHLHSLIYRSRARRLAHRIGAPYLRSALTALLVLPLPLISSVLMLVFHESRVGILASIAIVTLFYLFGYRKVALLSLSAPKLRYMRRSSL